MPTKTGIVSKVEKYKINPTLKAKLMKAAIRIIPIVLVLAFVIYRFAGMLETSRDGSLKGNIGLMRSAVAIYYGDHNGEWPKDLYCLIPQYLSAVPKPPDWKSVNHDEKAYGIPFEPISKSNKVVTKFDGTGGWVYSISGDTKDTERGQVYMNLNGTDTRGKAYRDY